MLEWYRHAAYYAADGAPFNYESFARDAAHPERLRFTLADGLALLKTKYPVRVIWRRHRAEENPDSIPALEGCEYLCIHRPGYEPQLARIDKTMFVLLARIKNGGTLKQSGDTVELNDTLAGLLPAAVQQGWVSGFLMYPVKT